MTVLRVDHTAIVVEDLDAAIPRWLMIAGARGGGSVSRDLVVTQNVEIAMIAVGDTRIELIRPTDTESGVARFLARHGESLHHVGLEVDDINEEMGQAVRDGMRLIDSQPRMSPHGWVAFVHPGSTGGVLVEFIQKA